MAYTCGAQNRFCGLERRAILTAASFPPSLHRPLDALGEKPCSLTLVRDQEAFGFDAVSLKAIKITGRMPCDFLVGVTGFEPMASWSRTKRTTKLCHTPAKIQSYGLQLCCLRPKRRQTVPHPGIEYINGSE